VISKLPPQPQQHIQAQAEETNKSDTEEGPNDHFENDLVLLPVQRMLLPLLMKEEFLHQDLWAPDADSAAVGGAALHSIATELRQHSDDSLSATLETRQAPTSPNTKETPNVLPMLKAYGVSLEDRSVDDNLLQDLYVLNKQHSKSSML
jgi:hypothetical protein